MRSLDRIFRARAFLQQKIKKLSDAVRKLFSNGEQGVWYDPSDLTTLYQDAAGTTPVTAVEQPVGLMLDKSKNGVGNHATQTTSTSRPVLSARVNLLTKTEAFQDTGVWVDSSGTTTRTSGALDPNGGTTAVTVAFGAANMEIRQVISVVSAIYKFAFWVKGVSGETLQYGIESIADQTVTLNGSWQLVTFTSISAVAPLRVWIGTWGGATARTVSLWGASLVPANQASLPYQRVNTATDYDTAGFPHYLRFDGIDDFLVTNSINFTATDKMTVFAGLRKLSDASVFVELSSDTNANAGSFAVGTGSTWGAANTYGTLVRGGAAAMYTASSATYSPPITNIYTQQINFAGASASNKLQMRVNAVDQTLSFTGLAGTGNFGNYPLYIGRRGGTTLPLNGHLYSLIVRGAQSTDQQIIDAEKYVNSKTKAYV